MSPTIFPRLRPHAKLQSPEQRHVHCSSAYQALAPADKRRPSDPFPLGILARPAPLILAPRRPGRAHPELDAGRPAHRHYSRRAHVNGREQVALDDARKYRLEQRHFGPGRGRVEAGRELIRYASGSDRRAFGSRRASLDQRYRRAHRGYAVVRRIGVVRVVSRPVQRRGCKVPLDSQIRSRSSIALLREQS